VARGGATSTSTDEALDVRSLDMENTDGRRMATKDPLSGYRISASTDLPRCACIYGGGCLAASARGYSMYCEVSALFYRLWKFYNTLIAAQEHTIHDRNKIFWGTDFPYSRVEESIEDPRNVNQLVEGTALPPVQRRPQAVRLDQGRRPPRGPFYPCHSSVIPGTS
jgi:hypothetical protein